MNLMKFGSKMLNAVETRKTRSIKHEGEFMLRSVAAVTFAYIVLLGH